MTHHLVVRKRMPELRLELQAQTKRDAQRYSTTRKAAGYLAFAAASCRPLARDQAPSGPEHGDEDVDGTLHLRDSGRSIGSY